MELNLNNLSGKKFFLENNIEIELPNLSDLEVLAWNDWGPMYKVSLYSHDRIVLSYDGEVHTCNQEELRIETPMEVSTREKLPLFLVVEDDLKELSYFLYLDKDYTLGKVETYKANHGTFSIDFSDSNSMTR